MPSPPTSPACSSLTASGAVTVAASEQAQIKAISVAAAISLAAGGTGGVALSGGGATAQNLIGVDTSASIRSSTLASVGSLAVTARDTSVIDAIVGAAAAAVGGGGTAGVGVAIGVAIADNSIDDGSGGTGQIAAYTTNSAITSTGDVAVTATSQQSIEALVAAAAVAIALGGTAGVGASGAGVDVTNEIAVATQAYIDGTGTIGAGGISAGNVAVTASDQSIIGAVAGAAAVSASFAGTVGVSASIGISLARNTILSSIDAYISGVPAMAATSVAVTALDQAAISAASVAAAVAFAAAGAGGVSLAGGGATAENVIGVHTDASIVDSTLGTSGNKIGDVTVTASDISSIDATVGAAAVAAAGGGTAGVGIAIGAALADNQINDGTGGTGEVLAFIKHSSITSSGAVHLNAGSGKSITAVVVAAAAALAGGGTAGVAASGAGVDTSNTIAVSTRAYVDGSGTATIAITTAPRTLSAGTLVTVAPGYDPAKGVVGHTYQLKGSGAFDITQANYLDTNTWTDLGTLAPSYDTSLKDVSTKYEMLATGDEVLIAQGFTGTGTVGHIYRYTGSNTTTPVDLASTNYTTGPWSDLGAVKFASQPASGSATNNQQLTHGDIVKVTDGHNPAKGAINNLYAYKGTTGTTLDLVAADFTDTTTWTNLGVPKFDSTPVATKFASLINGDKVQVDPGYDPAKGVSGHIYQYIGTAASLNIASTDYTDLTKWKDLGGIKYQAQGVTPNRQNSQPGRRGAGLARL